MSSLTRFAAICLLAREPGPDKPVHLLIGIIIKDVQNTNWRTVLTLSK